MKTVVIYDAGYDGDIVGVVPMRAREFKQACQSFKFVEVGEKSVNVDRIIFFQDQEIYNKEIALKRKGHTIKRNQIDIAIDGALPSIQSAVREISERVLHDGKENQSNTGV